MYKCSSCGLGVIVNNVEKPIRACSCKKPDGTPATIVIDLKGEAKGRSQFAQK